MISIIAPCDYKQYFFVRERDTNKSGEKYITTEYLGEKRHCEFAKKLEAVHYLLKFIIKLATMFPLYLMHRHGDDVMT